MIELDVYVCASGELVVIHDDKVNRTTNGKGRVIKKTFKQLRQLNVGRGQKIPSLRQILDFIDRRAQVNIELKGRGTAKPVAVMIKEYVASRGWFYDDFLVSSFNHRELEKFKNYLPQVRLGVLISRQKKTLAYFKKRFQPLAINLPLKLAKTGLIKTAHQLGLKVLVWTVDDPLEIKKLKALGVDGIFSNFPDRL